MKRSSLVQSTSRRLRRFGALALVAGSVALGGCVGTVGVGFHLGPPVVIAHGHVHSAYCGHYRYRGHWYVSHGHRHGPGCGHRFHSGVWILVR